MEPKQRKVRPEAVEKALETRRRLGPRYPRSPFVRVPGSFYGPSGHPGSVPLGRAHPTRDSPG